MELFSALINELRAAAPELELREREPMHAHTSFRIGGPVRLMALPKSEEQAQALARVCARLGVEPFFMGNGTDLLVNDRGAEALVVKAFDGLSRLELADETTILAGSGVLLSRLAHFALEHGLTGLEFAHGIPGTLGGAVTMNAGAYGGEMRQVAARTEYLEPDGERAAAEGEAHGFAYRRSAFSDGRRLILNARLALAPGEKAAIRARMDELADKRRAKQPLDLPSAGSTFKRPAGHFAGTLIEQCGLKGLTVGGAQVSEKHAGFVVNRGGATCADVTELIRQVQARVLEQTGVRLEPEVRIIG